MQSLSAQMQQGKPIAAAEGKPVHHFATTKAVAGAPTASNTLHAALFTAAPPY
jgi:hypothetical protein